MEEGRSNSFGARDRLTVADTTYDVFRLDRIQGSDRLPYALKVLLENLLRNEDGRFVSAEQVQALADWDPSAEHGSEIQFTPARVLLQDFTGVPCVVDLVAMRDAMTALGGDPQKINPLIPAELVIDHSVIAEAFGRSDAFRVNAEWEFDRNQERYQLLRWAQQAFDNFRVVPPDTGICHQVNLEYLSRVVFDDDGLAYPDTLVGTDSHTPMVNGLGVLGWGVGGIEAEAAMLGQPMSMLIPPVVGLKLSGELREGTTATDMVLTVAELLRRTGVVGSFVEFYGPGVANVPLANRATLGNMSPEYGSTASIFPIDQVTLDYLRLTGRTDSHVRLVEAYAKEQGLWHDPSHEATYSKTLELDLTKIEPSIAGPKRPQDRIPLSRARQTVRALLAGRSPVDEPPTGPQERDWPSTPVPVTLADGTATEIDHGHVVIAAITSCTNTSNPSLMVGAGLMAKRAVEFGLAPKPWVKTSLAPGSRVVTDYYDAAGLTPYLDKLGFNLVGYGCTTCIGNSGPLLPEISEAVDQGGLAVCAVLSGNRNFEGRINADVRMNYLASPPLVVAYALAGTMDIDMATEPLGTSEDGSSVFLADIWPTTAEVNATVAEAVESEMFRKSYGEVFLGDERWQGVQSPTGSRYDWSESTYVRKPPYFDGMPAEPGALVDVKGARVLARLGDSVTTDHISPAGSIRKD
ncbi:MAG: aconitate hydratase AcnA, partial [Mycobacteriales bacterium]